MVKNRKVFQRLFVLADLMGVSVVTDMFDSRIYPNAVLSCAGYYDWGKDVIYLGVYVDLPLECLLAHELVHSTGHQTRLNRLKTAGKPFFDRNSEERVANYGAIVLLKLLGAKKPEKYFEQYFAWDVETYLRPSKTEKQKALKAVRYLKSLALSSKSKKAA